MSESPSDVERVAQGFREEHEHLLEEADVATLQRIVRQAQPIATALYDEATEATNRSRDATIALTEAIKNPATPAVRMHELEKEMTRLRGITMRKRQAAEEFDNFLQRAAAAYRRKESAGG